MGEILEFVNSNQGALLLVLVILGSVQTVELRNVKGWVSEIQDDVKDLQKGKDK